MLIDGLLHVPVQGLRDIRYAAAATLRTRLVATDRARVHAHVSPTTSISRARPTSCRNVCPGSSVLRSYAARARAAFVVQNASALGALHAAALLLANPHL